MQFIRFFNPLKYVEYDLLVPGPTPKHLGNQLLKDLSSTRTSIVIGLE